MERFLSSPPLGATLPQTATRLSDLVGGVYGPGASVASTGMNTLRPAIKAGIALLVGETWEDVVEYYSVSTTIASCSLISFSLAVQCRPRRGTICLPPGQDLLSRKYLSFHGRHCFRQRRCWPGASKFSSSQTLLREDSPERVAA